MKNDPVVKIKADELKEMTSSFCIQFLDEEYKNLCNKLVDKMSRKRAVPFLSGKKEIWASAVVYAIGSINFLFDKSFTPYATADDICGFFKTSKSTTSQKAKLIKDMFNLDYYDDEFSTQSTNDSNPMNDMVMINGFIVNKKG
jgi:hypothetical protein